MPSHPTAHCEIWNVQGCESSLLSSFFLFLKPQKFALFVHLAIFGVLPQSYTLILFFNIFSFFPLFFWREASQTLGHQTRNLQRLSQCQRLLIQCGCFLDCYTTKLSETILNFLNLSRFNVFPSGAIFFTSKTCLTIIKKGAFWCYFSINMHNTFNIVPIFLIVCPIHCTLFNMT